jgi:Arc/MetJ-type ribon-helix-helix transcriptional regulator
MTKKHLKRTDINITEDQYIFITKEVEQKGLSMSEVIRRALDKYIDDKKSR